MALSLATLEASRGAKKNRKRLGRGNASGKGTTAGRGTKGQRARSGGRSGLALKGLKFIVQCLPKNKGFRSPKPKLAGVNIELLERYYQNNQAVSPTSLFKLGLIKTSRYGVKILGQGKLTKKLTVSAQAFSAQAKAAIEKAGGRVEIIGQTGLETAKE